ncbi:MAG TPA: glycosyltransferase family 2 protein [Anaeromyxobacteraceae bacterium]|nr:glycosyltransferase family 2 protein [Anaeromyxobacteraceae bacterium]
MFEAMIASLAFVAFTYVIYPLAMLLRARWLPRPVRPIEPHRWPTVTCVVASHDEGERLVDKVRALLSTDYPPGLLEVVVADDGSSDGSPSRARALDPARVRVASNPKQAGKPSALVRAVAIARGDVLLLCDARQRLAPGAVRALVAPMADPGVGAVTGHLRLDAARGPGAYWTYETAIRRAEGRTGSVVGATGAIYAVRRELFPRTLPADTILDDVYVPMTLIRGGFRVAYAEDAIAYDLELDVSREFVRKVRTLAGNFQLLAMLPWLASPLRNPVFWRYFWHKIARLLCPAALAIALVTSFEAHGLLANALFAAQLYLYSLAAFGHVRASRAGRAATLCCTFVALNLAAVMGFVTWVRRANRVTWVQTSTLGGGSATH